MAARHTETASALATISHAARLAVLQCRIDRGECPV
jgi:hypothetical protein